MQVAPVRTICVTGIHKFIHHKVFSSMPAHFVWPPLRKRECELVVEGKRHYQPVSVATIAIPIPLLNSSSTQPTLTMAGIIHNQPLVPRWWPPVVAPGGGSPLWYPWRCRPLGCRDQFPPADLDLLLNPTKRCEVHVAQETPQGSVMIRSPIT